jgi:ornithine--oxo-acid transaminase
MLCEMTGQPKALPMNTGAEAVETAIKAARKWGYKVKGIANGNAQIIVCSGNFAGRTTTIVGFSSEPQYRDGFGPFAPGFTTVPFGDAAALEAAITPHTAAFLVEPIQGEGGIIVPPRGYLAACREICTRHDVLMICDEVQTGLGRSGRLLACDHEAVKPDGLILGKALGGGLLPVSAFLAREDVMDVFSPGDHGSTFGGNPLAAAVGLAALRLLRDEHLAERAQTLGAYLIAGLRDIRHPAIREVRGKGLLIGLDLDPAWISARAFCEALMQRGILSKETHETVVRFAPPLIITQDELDAALAVIGAVFDSLLTPHQSATAGKQAEPMIV